MPIVISKDFWWAKGYRKGNGRPLRDVAVSSLRGWLGGGPEKSHIFLGEGKVKDLAVGKNVVFGIALGYDGDSLLDDVPQGGLRGAHGGIVGMVVVAGHVGD